MLAMPISQTGRRARRKTSQTSKAAVLSLLAPRRWHTEAVAVQKLAAMASRSAFSISPAPRPWLPRSPPAPQQAAILSWSQPSGVQCPRQSRPGALRDLVGPAPVTPGQDKRHSAPREPLREGLSETGGGVGRLAGRAIPARRD